MLFNSFDELAGESGHGHEFHSRYSPYPDRHNATMVSRANQMHLVGPMVPQLGHFFAKQTTGSLQWRHVVRQIGLFDLVIVVLQ